MSSKTLPKTSLNYLPSKLANFIQNEIRILFCRLGIIGQPVKLFHLKTLVPRGNNEEKAGEDGDAKK